MNDNEKLKIGCYYIVEDGYFWMIGRVSNPYLPTTVNNSKLAKCFYFITPIKLFIDAEWQYENDSKRTYRKLSIDSDAVKWLEACVNHGKHIPIETVLKEKTTIHPDILKMLRQRASKHLTFDIETTPEKHHIFCQQQDDKGNYITSDEAKILQTTKEKYIEGVVINSLCGLTGFEITNEKIEINPFEIRKGTIYGCGVTLYSDGKWAEIIEPVEIKPIKPVELEVIKTIYSLSLHEILSVNDNLSVTRVAGGWIYQTRLTPNPSTTFVPYNTEYSKW